MTSATSRTQRLQVSSDAEDLVLLRRFTEHGDREALGVLFLRHASAAYRVALRYTNRSSDAEDAVQAGFLQVLRTANRFRGEASVRSYMLGAVIGACRHKRREEQRRAAREDYAAAGRNDVEEALDNADLREALSKALTTLPEKYRAAVWQYYFEGRSSAEMAERMQVPAATVRSQLARGLERLRTELASAGYELSPAAMPVLLDTLAVRAACPVLGEALARLAAEYGTPAAASACASGATATTSAGASKLGLGAKISLLFKVAAGALALSAVAGVACMAASTKEKATPAVAGQAAPIAETRDGEKKSAAPSSTPLGSPEFKPSQERPIGWRGDGTGRYTGATPPTTWSRVASSNLLEAKVQAKKPAGAAASGQPMARSLAAHHLQEWLVAGPFDGGGDPKPLDKEILPKEAELAPDDGEKAAGKTWARIETGSGVNLAKLAGGMTPGQVAYAYTNVYMPTAGKLCISWWVGQGSVKLWINGKPCNAQGEWGQYEFVQGWNRVLVKGAANAKGECAFGDGISPPNFKYEDKNIRWVLPMPGESFSMPTICGEKLFVTADQASLLCLDKNTGKILWMRSTSVIDAAETEKGKLAEDAEAKGLRDELNALLESYVKNPVAETAKKANELYYQKIHNVTKKDAAYAWQGLGGWGGGSSTPTPATDGEHVFVYNGDFGLTSCFDLDGKRLWTRFARTNGAHHGINATPYLSGNQCIIYGARWISYDKLTGKELWSRELHARSYGTPVKAMSGNTEYMIAPDGEVTGVLDGQTVAAHLGRFDGECASAIVDNDRFFLFARAGFASLKVPASANAAANAPVNYHIAPETFKPWAEPYPVGTPLYHEGLVYATQSGWGAGDGKPYLMVFEADTGKMVYKVSPEVFVSIQYSPKGAGLSASLTLAGKYIYMFDNLGSCTVFETGREYKVVARNVLHAIPWPWHMNETFESAPVFEGSRMYVRGTTSLYCIGEK